MDSRTDGRTEFSSQDGVCIPCSAIKIELLKGKTLQGCVDMNIHGYIHVWISDLRHAVDASVDVRYQCLVSDTGIRINDFTFCVCIGDADTLLLLRIFYSFLFILCSSYYSFSPNLNSLLLSGNEHDNWNFNAMHRMVSICGHLLNNIINLI